MDMGNAREDAAAKRDQSSLGLREKSKDAFAYKKAADGKYFAEDRKRRPNDPLGSGPANGLGGVFGAKAGPASDHAH